MSVLGFRSWCAFGGIRILLAGQQRDNAHNDKQYGQNQYNRDRERGHGKLLYLFGYIYYTFVWRFWFRFIS